MGLWGSGACHSVVGLDLGSSSIKLVQLVNRGEGWKLVRAVLREIGQSGDSSREEKERVTALHELFRGIPLKKSRVIVTLNSPETDIKIFTVPPMPKQELKEALSFEAKQKFLFPIENSVIDFEEEPASKSDKKHRVLIASCPQKTVNEVLSLLKQASIKPASLLPSARSVQNLVSASSGAEALRSALEIGHAQSELLIFNKNQLVFCRKIPLGGRDFTRSMLGVFASDRGKVELTWEEAEVLKRNAGLPSEGTVGMVNEKISSSQLYSMLRSPLEQLANEIERCVDYYHEETGGGEERLRALILFGSGAYLKGLVAFLSQALDLEVKLGNPLEGIDMEAQIVIPEQGFSHFASALGAALSLGRGLNLLPPEIKEETKRTLHRATIQSFLAGAVLILVFIYTGLNIQLINLEKRISTAQMEIGSLQFDLGEVEKQRAAQAVSAEEPAWEDVFKELSNRIPSGVALTEFNVDRESKKIVLQGLIRAPEREAVLSSLIQNLEDGIFNGMKLIKVEEKPDQKESQFVLEGWVESGA